MVEVDFASVESLTAALKGIDAVVSTVAGPAIKFQGPFVDAAAAAGVERFIPSEYGAVTTNPKLETYPLYDNVTKIRRQLQDKAKSGQMSWTVLAIGGFMEFMLAGPPVGLLDFASRKAELFDEGDNRISATSLATSGQAIAAILKNPEATKNKVVRTSEVVVTQNQLLKIAQRQKPEDKWEISKISTSALFKEGLDEFNADNTNMYAVMKIIKGTALAGDTYGSAYDETDNKLLGVKELTEKDVEKLVAERLA